MDRESSIAKINSVALKIYGVVALCLLSTVLVASVTIYQLTRIGQELDSIANYDAPLTASLTEVTVHQLEQAILFERAVRSGEVMADHPSERAAFDASVKKFDAYDAKVDQEFAGVHALLADAKAHAYDAAAVDLFNGVGAELTALEEIHKRYAEHAHEVFELARNGDLDTMLSKLPAVVEEEEALDHGLETLLMQVQQFTIDATKAANAHEVAALNQVIWISVIALALGAFASWLAVRRFVTDPLSEVAVGVFALCRGDLNVEARKRRDDEIGVIADGLTQFRENARRVEALSKEREEADRAAEEARRAMMTQLQQSFSVVVDGAVAGDFSGRVAENFSDAELNQLAHGVNQLLEAVDGGLKETGRVMGALADGDLMCRMEGSFKGAFATLKDDTNQTIERLSALIGEISTTAEGVLGGATTIAESSVQLAGRAEQQASSLQETAATMEEMSASVKSNADRASGASSLAAQTSSEAQMGGHVVKDAIAAVSEIETSSAKIADIIAVIDGIAFQTNLLALNAAVEAARAGDAGKGFAVVASEVRALAQRSSDAARDIRELIEGSTSQVQKGVSLVTQTGEFLTSIVESISKVEAAIGDIAGASAEQSTGVQEISTAICHLDEITQSNASLADEGASNSRGLSDDAEKLKTLIGAFRRSDQPVAIPVETVRDREWEAVANTPVVEPKRAAAANDAWAEF